MATLSLLSTSTPYAAFFLFQADDSATVGLKKTGAGVGDTAVSSLPAGPLKALLTRNDDWYDSNNGILNKVTIRLSAAPTGVSPTVPLIGTPVKQSHGVTVDVQAEAIVFTSAETAGATTAYRGVVEVRLIHSSLR